MMSLPLTDVCVLERPSVKCKNKNLACLLGFQCFYYLSFPRNAQSSASTQPQPVLAFSQFNNSCVPCDLQTALCLSNNAIEGLHVRCLPSFVWTCVGEYGRSVCVLGYSLSLSLSAWLYCELSAIKLESKPVHWMLPVDAGHLKACYHTQTGSHARVKTQQVCVCCLSTDRMERFASLITARTVVWVWTTQLWFEHSWEGLMPSTSFISCYKVPQFYIVMLHRCISVCLRAKMFIK